MVRSRTKAMKATGQRPRAIALKPSTFFRALDLDRFLATTCSYGVASLRNLVRTVSLAGLRQLGGGIKPP
jgi:hypothetical protein